MSRTPLPDIIFYYILVPVLALLTLALTGLMFYDVADRTFLTAHQEHTTVIRKHFNPGEVTTNINPSDNDMPLTISTTPDSWHLVVKHETGNLHCRVSRRAYNKIKLGQNIVVNISTGRFSNKTHCKGVAKL